MKKLTELQQAALLHCGTFGFASTRDISRLVWPNHGAHSAHVMAQRMLTKLMTEKLLFARDIRQLPDTKLAPAPKTGIPKAYVLTVKGADVLNESYMDVWLETDFPAGSKPQTWFADGYNLTLKDHVVRRPVMEVCFQMATGTGLHPVGQRACARNFLGLSRYSHFDAVLVDAEGRFVVGVHLAHLHTPTATTDISRLAGGPDDFLICCGPHQRLASFLKWRAGYSAAMSERVQAVLPPGLLA